MYKNFLLSILVLGGALFGGQIAMIEAASTTTATTTAVTSTSTATSTVTTATTTSTSTPVVVDRAMIEKRVREFFSDTPIMIEIALCESNYRQFTDSGMPFRGGMGGGMVGVFQFYETIHTAAAKALGFDLTTLEGNIGYARAVYIQSGTTPWSSCVPATVSLDATTKLKIELMTKLVGLLQQLLSLELAKG